MMIQKVTDFFTSTKLAITLFLALAVTSIAGTLIQQGLPPEHYRALYRPEIFSLLKTLHMFDMYHSWWYLCLLALFAVNITVCTGRQLPRIRRVVFPGNLQIDDHVFTSWQIRKKIRLEEESAAVRERVVTLAQALARTPRHIERGGRQYFYAEKGRYARVGMVCIHTSILLILAGSLVGALWGFDGSMNIVEGRMANTVTLYGDKGTTELGFYIRCDDFTVEYYDNGMPREYRSDVTVVEGKDTVRSGSIRVNHPLRYRGVKFCQSTYDLIDVANIKVKVRNNATDSEKVLVLERMKKMSLPDSTASLAVARFVPDFEGRGPAVLCVLLEPGKAHDIFWIVHRSRSAEGLSKNNFTFAFEDFNDLYYTGLQVSNDPGGYLVWTGFIMIVVGFILSLFFTHTRVWIRISECEGFSDVTIAASVNKNRTAVGRKLDALLAELQVN
jgi:cytochrome c biogenesis protein